MNPLPARVPRPRASARGFSLLEIMIAVTIIGLLLTIAIPAFTRIRQRSLNTRFVSDLRTFTQAFESYAVLNGAWPPAASAGAVPTGMTDDDFKTGAWSVSRNSVGGRWNWDRDSFGAIAAITVDNVTATDAQMALIDAQIDDGNLSAGLFQKNSGRFVYALAQ
jgi:prepilin-type N-terminal cleavage/methylation domain-containing protein